MGTVEWTGGTNFGLRPAVGCELAAPQCVQDQRRASPPPVAASQGLQPPKTTSLPSELEQLVPVALQDWASPLLLQQPRQLGMHLLPPTPLALASSPRAPETGPHRGGVRLAPASPLLVVDDPPRHHP
jgi:hypothetical protein